MNEPEIKQFYSILNEDLQYNSSDFELIYNLTLDEFL